MKHILLSSALALVATGAIAGDPTPTYAEPEPIQAAPVAVPLGGDWTGAYAGLSFGNLDVDGGGFDDNGPAYGVFGGYDYDFGQFVLGGELEWQSMDDLDLGGIDIDNVTRLKVRAGYDAGPALIYGVLGAARADTSIGDADGAVAGLGMDYKVTDRFTVGAEYLAHRFDDAANSGIDVDANAINLRGALRF